LEKPKQRYIRLLENALCGFGLSKLGELKSIAYEIKPVEDLLFCIAAFWPYFL
jgi:hypothetical protein